MMNKIRKMRLAILALVMGGSLFLPLKAAGKDMSVAGTYKLSRWNIQPADYSGITALGNGLYAVVSDKKNEILFWKIHQDASTGKVLQVEEVRRLSLRGEQKEPALDLEAVTWWPERQTLSVASERTQTVRTYNDEGDAMAPLWSFEGEAASGQIHANYGFESLTYDAVHSCFWICTENRLRAHGAPVGIKLPEQALLPVYCLKDDGTHELAARYQTDKPQASGTARIYAFGVSEMLALPDYGLLVMEREFFVSKNYLRSWVHHKIYCVGLEELWQADGKVVQKQLLCEFRTRLNPFVYRLANYEGMCPGIRLKDGRQTLLLLSDAQGGAGNRLYHLKDFLRVQLLPSSDNK